MRLNDIKSAAGSRPAGKRAGRGIGSGLGKTAGRGHKGQKSRSGGQSPIGFEGGQMPLQRRVPKRGFHSRKAAESAEVRIYELAGVKGDVFDLEALKQAGIVGRRVKQVKVIAKGDIGRAVTLKGVGASKGARDVIEKAGGKVE